MPNKDDGQSTNGSELPDRLYKFFQNEIKFERTRKQEVFSWASSLLIAMIGGVIALTADERLILTKIPGSILSFSVGILCVYSCYWIDMHWVKYVKARRKLSSYYDKLEDEGSSRVWPHDYTSLAAVLLLSIVAIIAVWCRVGVR